MPLNPLAVAFLLLVGVCVGFYVSRVGARELSELGSNAELDNVASAEAHRALGFEDAGVVRFFKKSL